MGNFSSGRVAGLVCCWTPLRRNTWGEGGDGLTPPTHLPYGIGVAVKPCPQLIGSSQAEGQLWGGAIGPKTRGGGQQAGGGGEVNEQRGYEQQTAGGKCGPHNPTESVSWGKSGAFEAVPVCFREHFVSWSYFAVFSP